MLGIGLYGFMSYYQPVTESYATTEQVNAQTFQRQNEFEFISPIPYELVVWPGR